MHIILHHMASIVDLSLEQKDIIFKKYIVDKEFKKRQSKITSNYNFFENCNYLNFGINIKSQGSCSIGGDEWTQTFIVYYNNNLTLQFTLIANENGSYVNIHGYNDNGDSIQYLTGDLHEKEELNKFLDMLVKNSKILIHNYETTKKNMNVVLISDNRYFWIEKDDQKYKLRSPFTGIVHLYKLERKKDKKYEYKQIFNRSL